MMKKYELWRKGNIKRHGAMLCPARIAGDGIAGGGS